MSRLPRTRGLRSRPHPGPGAFASGRAASGAGATVQCIVRRRHPPAFGRAAPVPAPFARPRPSKACSPFRSSALLCLSGASAGRSATVHHVPSPYYLRDGQEEASASADATRSLRSGFRLLQPAPVNCRPLPPPQLGEHRPPHSRPSPRASLVWPVCSVWPSKAVQTLHPDQSDPRPMATFRHDLDRPAHWRWQSLRKKTPRKQQRLRRRCGCSSLDNSLKIRTFVSAPRCLPATSELKSCNPYEDPGSLHPDQ